MPCMSIWQNQFSLGVFDTVNSSTHLLEFQPISFDEHVQVSSAGKDAVVDDQSFHIFNNAVFFDVLF